jgi:uncharacterized protein (DUF488 family)
MKKCPLYSIGHGSRKQEELLELLKKYKIDHLADVRSRPYSRFHPQYNKEHLKDFLQQHGITYIFMGDELGGRPNDPSCYDEEGKVDYKSLSEKEFFKKGIERLKVAHAKNIALAIMCSERDPKMCHRSKLIGKVLNEKDIPIKHIDEFGKLRDQQEMNGTSLFT